MLLSPGENRSEVFPRCPATPSEAKDLHGLGDPSPPHQPSHGTSNIPLTPIGRFASVVSRK